MSSEVRSKTIQSVAENRVATWEEARWAFSNGPPAYSVLQTSQHPIMVERIDITACQNRHRRLQLLIWPIPPPHLKQQVDLPIIEPFADHLRRVATDNAVRLPSRVTKARVPITAPSPILIPGMMMASEPIHTSLPIMVSPAGRYPFSDPSKAETSDIQ